MQSSCLYVHCPCTVAGSAHGHNFVTHGQGLVEAMHATVHHGSNISLMQQSDEVTGLTDNSRMAMTE